MLSELSKPGNESANGVDNHAKLRASIVGAGRTDLQSWVDRLIASYDGEFDANSKSCYPIHNPDFVIGELDPLARWGNAPEDIELAEVFFKLYLRLNQSSQGIAGAILNDANADVVGFEEFNVLSSFERLVLDGIVEPERVKPLMIAIAAYPWDCGAHTDLFENFAKIDACFEGGVEECLSLLRETGVSEEDPVYTSTLLDDIGMGLFPAGLGRALFTNFKKICVALKDDAEFLFYSMGFQRNIRESLYKIAAQGEEVLNGTVERALRQYADPNASEAKRDFEFYNTLGGSNSLVFQAFQSRANTVIEKIPEAQRDAFYQQAFYVEALFKKMHEVEESHHKGQRYVPEELAHIVIDILALFARLEIPVDESVLEKIIYGYQVSPGTFCVHEEIDALLTRDVESPQLLDNIRCLLKSLVNYMTAKNKKQKSPLQESLMYARASLDFKKAKRERVRSHEYLDFPLLLKLRNALTVDAGLCQDIYQGADLTDEELAIIEGELHAIDDLLSLLLSEGLLDKSLSTQVNEVFVRLLIVLEKCATDPLLGDGVRDARERMLDEARKYAQQCIGVVQLKLFADEYALYAKDAAAPGEVGKNEGLVRSGKFAGLARYIAEMLFKQRGDPHSQIDSAEKLLASDLEPNEGAFIELVRADTQALIGEALEWGYEQVLSAREDEKYLLPVGDKLHLTTPLHEKVLNILTSIFEAYSTDFRSIHSNQALVMPPGVTSLEAQIPLAILYLMGIVPSDFSSAQLQITASGEISNELSGTVGASVLLSTRKGLKYAPGAFHTNQFSRESSRIMIRGPSSKRDISPWDLREAQARTDIMSRGSISDIPLYQFLMTLATHHQYDGPFKPIMERYLEKFRVILTEEGLLDALNMAEWTSSRNAYENNTELIQHEAMVGVFTNAWFEAQKQPGAGVHGRIVELIGQTMEEFFEVREDLWAAYQKREPTRGTSRPFYSE